LLGSKKRQMQQMKEVDASRYEVIKAGLEYKTSTPPCMVQMLQEMDRNESYIHWLQPLSGTVKDQIACLLINGKMYNVNQKIEKVLFRHIRLSKSFVNEEKLENGRRKLRIPHRLYQQKQKTSQRFLVSCLISVMKFQIVYCVDINIG